MSVTETDILRLSRRVKNIEELPGILGEMSLSEVGAITLWPLNSPPESWLLCDGAAVSRTKYADLFGKIGTAYGAGDGSATFSLPNLKGRVPVGRDAGKGELDTLGETWGGIANTSAQQFFVLNFIIRYQPYSVTKKGDKGDKGEKGDIGANAPQLAVQYSADGQNWHTAYAPKDNYLRLSTDGGNVWGNAVYIRGEQGQQGLRGEQGVPGEGVPVGGSTGQVLSKRTDADHDTQWADAAPVVAPAVDNLNDASKNSTVRIWEGTQVQFDALTSRSGDTIYIISDNGAYVDAVSDTLPIGTILNYSSDVTPLNWILCNGQAVSRYDYAELFAIIGTTFGTGDGLSTFNVPDMRGRVSVGKDTTQIEFDGLNTPSNYKGEKTHLLAANEIPPVSVNVGGTLASWNKTQTGSQARVNLSGTYAANWAGGYEVYTDGSGGGATNVPHNNLQPYRVLNYIIKAKNTVPIVASVEDRLTSTSTTNALSAYQGNILCSLITRPNLFLNSDFRIWQRALSQTVSGYASDDKWYNENSGTTKNHSRQTFTEGQTLVPNNPIYFSRTLVTSVTNANNYCVKSQKIENVRTLAGKVGTLSFYAKADSTKYIAIELIQVFGTGGSSVVTGIGAQRVLLSNSWQKYVVHVDVPSISGKTVMGGNFLQVCFWLEAGAAFGARSSNIGQQSGTFDIAQVKLEEGNIATTFVPKTLAEDLRDCQRYYEKSYDIDVIPAANSIVGMNAFHGTTQGAGVMAATVFFKVTKCKTPVVLPFTYAGVQGSWGYDRSGASGDVTTSAANTGQNSFQLQASLGVGWTNCTFYGHWIADADL